VGVVEGAPAPRDRGGRGGGWWHGSGGAASISGGRRASGEDGGAALEVEDDGWAGMETQGGTRG
jgi:hypothetical protein